MEEEEEEEEEEAGGRVLMFIAVGVGTEAESGLPGVDCDMASDGRREEL